MMTRFTYFSSSGSWVTITIVCLSSLFSVANKSKTKLAFTSIGPLQIELIQSVEGKTFYADFLEKHGEGIHHLGVRVDDIDATTANLGKKGVKVLFGRRGRFAYMDTGNPVESCTS